MLETECLFCSVILSPDKVSRREQNTSRSRRAQQKGSRTALKQVPRPVRQVHRVGALCAPACPQLLGPRAQHTEQSGSQISDADQRSQQSSKPHFTHRLLPPSPAALLHLSELLSRLLLHGTEAIPCYRQHTNSKVQAGRETSSSVMMRYC